VGGAESSLLETLSAAGRRPLFLVPSEGPLSRAVAARGWECEVVPWPAGLARLTQRNPLLLPAALPGLPAYLLRLHREFAAAGEILSSGVKSHGACLLLSPWHGSRIRYDVRDFIRPLWLRRLLAAAAQRYRSAVTANSAAVAADFPGARVEHPTVRLPRAPVSRRRAEGRRIVAHLAYFAPYKGQDLFLACARKLLDAGLDAEFWLAGDVIYPAPAYLRYRDEVYAQAARLGLASRVRFLGRIDGAGAVQELLEQTHLLLHCTREPEPFGRAVLEALLCGCEAVCHRGSGVCEVAAPREDFPAWMAPIRDVLGPDYARVALGERP
jgi:glycosyltransferase involved in cell wall biosynthesis